MLVIIMHDRQVVLHLYEEILVVLIFYNGRVWEFVQIATSVLCNYYCGFTSLLITLLSIKSSIWHLVTIFSLQTSWVENQREHLVMSLNILNLTAGTTLVMRFRVFVKCKHNMWTYVTVNLFIMTIFSQIFVLPFHETNNSLR